MSTVAAVLTELLALPRPKRIAAVSKDLRCRRDRYGEIEAHALAAAVGATGSQHPGQSGWSITAYAEVRSLEEQADEKLPPSEFVYKLQDLVTAERFAVLKAEFAKLDQQIAPKFKFLAAGERKTLEEALAREDLEGNISNGISSVARYRVDSRSSALWFEGDVEDDGECITLRTPYDQRDGKFTNLKNCVIEEW